MRAARQAQRCTSDAGSGHQAQASSSKAAHIFKKAKPGYPSHLENLSLAVVSTRWPACLSNFVPLAHRPQTLDSAELDFSRYGDVLFEVAFAGARLTTGGNVATEGKKLDFNVRPGLGCRV